MPTCMDETNCYICFIKNTKFIVVAKVYSYDQFEVFLNLVVIEVENSA